MCFRITVVPLSAGQHSCLEIYFIAKDELIQGLQLKVEKCMRNTKTLDALTLKHGWLASFDRHHNKEVQAKIVYVFITCAMTTLAPKEYQVGGAIDWRLPTTNETELYNVWSSRRRFHIRDSL
ncbi:hypothetical protein Tco_0726558, partial [Tanacetum coccineum]